MFCNVLEKYHSFPGFTLVLGSLFQFQSTEKPYTFLHGITTSLYLTQQWEEGHILDDTRLFGANRILSDTQAIYAPGTRKLFSYFTELLESPERSGTHILISSSMRWLPRSACNCTCVAIAIFPRGPQSLPGNAQA